MALIHMKDFSKRGTEDRDPVELADRIVHAVLTAVALIALLAATFGLLWLPGAQ